MSGGNLAGVASGLVLLAGLCIGALVVGVGRSAHSVYALAVVASVCAFSASLCVAFFFIWG